MLRTFAYFATKVSSGHAPVFLSIFEPHVVMGRGAAVGPQG